MKLNEAIELGKVGHWQDAQIRISPGSLNHWFVMLRDTQYKFFVLADNEDLSITTDHINELAQLIRSVGLKEFTVYL